MKRFIVSTFITRGLATLLNFLIVLLIARHSGPSIKGEVTLIITTGWFFIFLSNILGGQVLVYLVPRNQLEQLIIPAYLWSVIVAAAGFVLLRGTHIVHANHVTSIALLSFLSSLISIHQTTLLGRQDITKANLVQLIPLFLQVFGILFCFYFMHISDAYAYIYASLLAYGAAAVISFIFIKDQLHFPGWRNLFSIKGLNISFRYGIFYQLVDILQLLNLRYYYYQLSLQEGSRYLGIYSIGISILEIVWILPRSISTIHYVSTSNSAEVNKEAGRTVQLVKASFLLCAIALFFIWLVPANAYTLIFGPGFKDVKHSVRFLFPGMLVYSIPIVISSFYLGLGKYKQIIVSYLTGVITLVSFSWFLIPKFVMSGAGLAASISFTTATLVLFCYFLADTGTPVSKFWLNSDDWAIVKNWLRFAAKAKNTYWFNNR